MAKPLSATRTRILTDLAAGGNLVDTQRGQCRCHPLGGMAYNVSYTNREAFERNGWIAPYTAGRKVWKLTDAGRKILSLPSEDV